MSSIAFDITPGANTHAEVASVPACDCCLSTRLLSIVSEFYLRGPYGRVLSRMSHSKQNLWQRFQKYYFEFPSAGLALDISRMNFPEDHLPCMEPLIQKAFLDMAALEHGTIAIPDENRNVGHYPLEPFSKYLQQLTMESLGKRLDLSGKEANQALTVLGNKALGNKRLHPISIPTLTLNSFRDGLNNSSRRL